MAERYENTFVREVKERSMTDASEILNWYRNLYHTEDNHTEQGIVCYAINDLFMEYKDVVPKSEVEKLKADLIVWKQDRFNLYQRLELYEITRQKVAREIFEEIERFLYLQFRFCKEEIGNDDTEYVKGRMELNTQIQNFIAELEKKYIHRECPKCKYFVGCEKANWVRGCDEYTEGEV